MCKLQHNLHSGCPVTFFFKAKAPLLSCISIFSLKTVHLEKPFTAQIGPVWQKMYLTVEQKELKGIKEWSSEGGKKIIPGSRAERGVGLLEGAWSIVGKTRLIFCFPTDLVATHLKFPMTPGWPWTSPLENSPVKHPRRAKCHISSSENDGNFFSSSSGLKPETRTPSFEEARFQFVYMLAQDALWAVSLSVFASVPLLSLSARHFHPNCATVCHFRQHRNHRKQFWLPTH